MRKFIFTLFCLAFIFAGCDTKTEESLQPRTVKQAASTPAATFATQSLLQDSIEPKLVEIATQALPIWRKFSTAKPSLVLLSKGPLLAPVPPSLENETTELLTAGPDQDILARVQHPQATPLLLPIMTASAAINAGLISEFIWVFPTALPLENFNAEQFRSQLVDFGITNEHEADTLVWQDGAFTGILRGIPFRAIHPEALPQIDTPIILHIDLSFFQPFYKGEIKTPVFELIYQQLELLQKTGWQTLAVSISYSNLTLELPLSSRFMGPILATLFATPAKLTQPLSQFWVNWANALHLPNFLKTEETRELYLKMAETHPMDSNVKYGLYKALRDTKEGTRALQVLDEAVSLDPVFAIEYLELVTVAREKNKPQEALRMVSNASKAFPENPLIRLQLVEELIKLGELDQANTIIKELQKLHWSEVYYPQIPTLLDKLAADYPIAEKLP